MIELFRNASLLCELDRIMPPELREAYQRVRDEAMNTVEHELSVKDNRWCYVAQREGQPGYHAMIADLPAHPKHIADAVAQCIASGAAVSRVPYPLAAAGLSIYMDWKAKQSPAPGQAELLDDIPW